MTTTIREIRGWAPSTPIPHAPSHVLGVMNLRESVIPIVDLSSRLVMGRTVPNDRSAIVVADVHTIVLGLRVDEVWDILTVRVARYSPYLKSRHPSTGDSATALSPKARASSASSISRACFSKSILPFWRPDVLNDELVRPDVDDWRRWASPLMASCENIPSLSSRLRLSMLHSPSSRRWIHRVGVTRRGGICAFGWR